MFEAVLAQRRNHLGDQRVILAVVVILQHRKDLVGKDIGTDARGAGDDAGIGTCLMERLEEGDVVAVGSVEKSNRQRQGIAR